MSVNKIIDPAKDPYEVLGLTFGASDSEIAKAYRNLARTLHPDKLVSQNLSPAEKTLSATRFHDIQVARSFLLDAENTESRRKYDAKQASEQMRRAADITREAGMTERRKRMRDELKLREEQADILKKDKRSLQQAAETQASTKDALAREGLKMRERFAAKDAAAKSHERDQAVIDIQSRQIRLKWSRKKLISDSVSSPSEDSIAKMLSLSCGSVEQVQMLGNKGNAALVTFLNEASCNNAVNLYRTSETWRAVYVNKDKQREDEKLIDLLPPQSSHLDQEDVNEWKLRQAIERGSMMEQMEFNENGGTGSHKINDDTASTERPFPPPFPIEYSSDGSRALYNLEKLEDILLQGLVPGEIIHRMKVKKL
jgi:DnaJ homolog subfamily C member 17